MSLRLMAETDVFKHSTPELYDRYMGPLLFAPYAEHVANLIAARAPERILETAAGTGIVTRAVSKALPTAEIIATDVNPAVVEFAAGRNQSERVTFQRADAQELPFDDGSFDAVLCLFGAMFFPDKPRANAEARRVLRPGACYVLVAFNRLDLNPVPQAAGAAVALHSGERSSGSTQQRWNGRRPPSRRPSSLGTERRPRCRRTSSPRRGRPSRVAVSRPAPAVKEGLLTVKGHPRAIFERAIERGNLAVAETVLRAEIPRPTLVDLLELTALIAQTDPGRRGRVTTRWLQRYLEAGVDRTIDEVAFAVAALQALGTANHCGALEALREIARRVA